MMDEKLKILRMVEQGKISAKNGLELLNSLENLEEKVKPSKWIRIKVWESENNEEVDISSKPKVNVNIPFSLAKIALKFIPGETKKKLTEKIKKYGDMDFDIKDLPLEELLEQIKQLGSFTLVEVDEKDTKVRIVLE